MGDDVDTSSISLINDPPVQEVESTMEDKPSGETELPSTGQCDSVPESVLNLDDSQSVGAETSVDKEEDAEMDAEEAEGGDIVVEGREDKCVSCRDDLPVNSAELAAVLNDGHEETVATKDESIVVESGEETSVPGADDFAVSGAELAAVGNDEDRETVVAEGNITVEGREEKGVPEWDDLQVGSVEVTAVVKDDEAEKVVVVEENLVLEGRDAVDGEESSVAGAGELTVSEPTVLEEHDNDMPVGGAELASAVEEDDLAATKDQTLMAEIETGTDTETVVNGNAEYSSELHVVELADMRALGVVDDTVGNAVTEMDVEAGGNANGDVVAMTTDVVGTVAVREENEEISMEETKTEIKRESEVTGGSDIIAPEGDVTTFKDDEMGREESKGSDDAIDQEEEEEDDMAMQSKMKSSEGESHPDAEDSEQQGTLSPMAANEDEEDTRMADEEIQTVDTEMETETEVEPEKGATGKRKRGRNSKSPSIRVPARKTVGEDVCFICFDGGDLVLCDRR